MTSKKARAAQRLRNAEAYYRAHAFTASEEAAGAVLKAHNEAGVAQAKAGRHAAARAAFEAVLQKCPTHAEAWFNLGLAENELGQAERAYACFAQAVMLTPRYTNAEANLARLAAQTGQPAEILTPWVKDPRPGRFASLARQVRAAFGAATPVDFAPVDPDEATVRRKFEAAPDSPDCAMQLGRVLLRQRRDIEAGAFLLYALRLAPWHENAAYWLSLLLHTHGAWEELLARARQAIAHGARGEGLHAYALWSAAHLCDWTDMAQLRSRVRQGLDDDPALFDPYMTMLFTDDPRLQLACASAVSAVSTIGCRPLPPVPRARHAGKLTIGYVSAEFRDHAVARVLGPVLAQHDRERFVVKGYATCPTDDSKFGKRICKACDTLTTLMGDTDEAYADRIRADGVDILVDVTGFTAGSRPRLFALRPAPIQVNYLGYLTTLGTPATDYAILDRTVLSQEQARYFTEAPVYMPDSYFPNDRCRETISVPTTRRDHGLPENAVVFCCFNTARKIQPEIFDVWMRILGRVPNGVLWLKIANERARQNLRDVAASRGIDPSRLVFVTRVKSEEEHMARYALADLFLDTDPYNAHTTASDALRMGCPVLTLLGRSVQGRVAASLLTAIGLAELITTTAEHYEDLAVRIGVDGGFRTGLRAKLAAARFTCALFDVARYTRHLEAAYEEMWRRYCAGEKPAAFDVPPVSASV